MPKVSLPALFVTAVVAAGVVIVGWRIFNTSGSSNTVEVTVPELSQVAQQGKQLFDANCAKCHGANASGSDNGPPLVHRIYEPNHHGDHSFALAVSRGVRAHHWPYGNMPAVSGVSEEDVKLIVQYVRELQAANGIF